MSVRRGPAAKGATFWLVFLLLLLWGCSGESGRTDEGDEIAAGGAAGGTPSASQAQAPPAAGEGLVKATADIAPDGSAVAEGQEGGEQPEEEARGYPDVPLPKLDSPETRQAAPQVALTDMAGRQFTLESLRGQVVLVTFWATWCPPCKKEIPQLVHLQDTYDKDGFKVLGISLDQKGLSVVRPFVRGRREINYTIIPNGTRAGQAFGGVRRIPTTFLLDRAGRIIAKFTGLHPQAKLDGLVQAALLEEYGTAAYESE